MTPGGCLLRVLAAMIIFPLAFALPPLGFFVFAFFAFTLYFYRKG